MLIAQYYCTTIKADLGALEIPHLSQVFFIPCYYLPVQPAMLLLLVLVLWSYISEVEAAVMQSVIGAILCSFKELLSSEISVKPIWAKPLSQIPLEIEFAQKVQKTTLAFWYTSWFSFVLWLFYSIERGLCYGLNQCYYLYLAAQNGYYRCTYCIGTLYAVLPKCYGAMHKYND